MSEWKWRERADHRRRLIRTAIIAVGAGITLALTTLASPVLALL
ncbi:MULTISPECIES: hypothetical protein [unclassified Microbacterium]|nr:MULTISPECIES: hypothetical protein [unclassified Microbacterium]